MYIVVIWLTASGVVPGWASTVGLLSLLGGIQLLTLGVIGEYLGRLFLEVKARPIYVVEGVYQEAPEDDASSTPKP